MRLWASGVTLATLGLLGCAGAAPLSNGDAAPTRGFLGALVQPQAPGKRGAGRAPATRLSLAEGDVIVAGPEGYCVDPQTTQARRGFAVMASCLILSDGESGVDVPPAVITVTVGPPGTAPVLPEAASLAAAAEARMLSGGARDGLVIAHLASGGDTVLADGDARYWRGAFVQNGHLVGLALYAPKGSSLAGEGGEALLARTRSRIAAESAPDA